MRRKKINRRITTPMPSAFNNINRVRNWQHIDAGKFVRLFVDPKNWTQHGKAIGRFSTDDGIARPTEGVGAHIPGTGF